MSEYQCSAIETHIEMLLEPELLKRIGADKVYDRPLHLRVMRIFAELDRLEVAK